MVWQSAVLQASPSPCGGRHGATGHAPGRPLPYPQRGCRRHEDFARQRRAVRATVRRTGRPFSTLPGKGWVKAVHIYKLSGRNVDVTDAMRDYVEEKLTRLDRYSDSITDARVTLTVRDVKDSTRRNRVEVQLNVPHGIIRAEEHHADMYAAIDKASDVLERQLRKFKTRYMKQRQEGRPEPRPGPAEAAVNSGDDVSDFQPEIVRQKRFDVRPMSAEDAIVQMEALDHDFYVFKDLEGKTSVVYRRKDGHYGLIETN